MIGLSNSLREADETARFPADHRARELVPLCRPARPEETHPALRLILAHDGRPADDAQVLEFLRFAAHRGINTNDVWVAERDGQLVSAVLPVVSPGRTMLLLVPPDPARTSVAAAALAEAACGTFANRGVQLAQVLLDARETASHALYEAQGFTRMAELIYLQVAAPRRQPVSVPLPGLAWVNYSPETHVEFASAISASYRDSLDCPALNGVRDIEDVIVGHQAGGEFDPSLWFLLRERGGVGGTGEGAVLGVLLLGRTPLGDAVELVYLGLVPAARGRGLGDVMMRQALSTAAARGAARLTLAVDSGNVPALKLYERYGLQRIGSKLAMMRPLAAPPPRSQEQTQARSTPV